MAFIFLTAINFASDILAGGEWQLVDGRFGCRPVPINVNNSWGCSDTGAAVVTQINNNNNNKYDNDNNINDDNDE